MCRIITLLCASVLEPALNVLVSWSYLLFPEHFLTSAVPSVQYLSNG